MKNLPQYSTPRRKRASASGLSCPAPHKTGISALGESKDDGIGLTLPRTLPPSRCCRLCLAIVDLPLAGLAHHESDTQVVQRRVRRRAAPRGRPEATAAVLIAEERATAHRPLAAAAGAPGILARAFCVVIGVVEVRTPLPDVARDVIEPIPIGGERLDRGADQKPVFPGILGGERSLPKV